ncbi:MAG: transposase [Deltaproteobacteria bacterium]|nr:transposase [Deltaproteobacteria bacterium]
MSRRIQNFLPGFENLGFKQFGGSLVKGNPREPRPISIRRPIHIVMRSSHAKGERSFLAASRARKIERLVHRLGDHAGVRVYRYANSGNHLHLLVVTRSRKAFRAYLRAISGIIARMTLGVERGKALGLKFWDARPFTRIVEWGREFRAVCRYVAQNTLEALGFIPFQPRKHKTKLVAATA